MRRFALIAALALTAQAAPHRLRVYPNSLTIFSIAQGPDGMLWLAAEDGLYSFDGFHYHKIPSYPFASARFAAFTRDGSLWVADFEGLTRVRNHKFEIVLSEEVSGLAAYPDQIFAKVQFGLVRVGLDGSMRRLKLPVRRDLSIDSDGRLWFACQLTAGCSYDPAHPDQPQSLEFPPTSLYAQVVRDSLGRIWAADPERAFLMEDGHAVETLERLRSQKTDRPGPLLTGRHGQLWFLGETVRGLIPKIEFRDRADHDRFPPISGLEDNRNHLWVASLGQGLVEWTPDSQWQRWFPEDFGKETPVEVVRDQHGSKIVATQKNVYRLNPSSDRWSQITNQPFRYYALFPLDDGGFLASIRDFGLARLSPEGQVVEHLQNLVPDVDLYREIIRDGKGRIWVGAKRALLRVEGRPGSLRLRNEDLPDVPARHDSDPVDLALDASHHLWVGYSQGLAWLDDQDHWHKIATDQPVTMVRSFALAGDDIWVAYRRNGAFSRLHRDGDRWNVTLFAPGGGYVPAGTEFLKRDSRGWIWRGTDQGVYVCDGLHAAPNDWLHIHLGNGLAANEMGQYGFFEDPDGSVWLTGDEGVSRLDPDASWFNANWSNAPRGAPPRITRIDADGRIFLYPEPFPTSLPAATKVLRVDAGSLNVPPFRTFPLRYRLLPGPGAWQLSRDGSFEFRNLSDRDYSLQISFTGNGTTPTTTYEFRVGAGHAPVPWRWIIALLSAIAALALLIRFVPGLERVRFRIEKTLFLLRRRLSSANPSAPAPAAPAAPDHSGETLLGRYRLSRILSRGGFSVVYEARDLRDGNARLAVKVLNRNSKQESWVRDRFAHEVAALGSVKHPGVVPIFDSWISAAGEPCLAMPFLNGRTLRAALEEGPLSPADAARIVTQLGSALADVHGRGIVHRDLKPENLILAENQVVIIDFGTAGLKTAENELAATTVMSGSFHYMAPERLTGHYSPASDVFSLGVIILEMLTGQRLAALTAMPSDSSFQAELENALAARLTPQVSKILAALLAPSYNPDPRRRPLDVSIWSENVAHALEATTSVPPARHAGSSSSAPADPGRSTV